MRGIGALIVMIAHGSRSLFQGANPAIDMFFLHSGFILAYVTVDRSRDRSFAGAFIVSRLIRLLPLYWAGMLLGAAVSGYLMVFGDLDWTALDLLQSTLLSLFVIPELGHPSGWLFPTNIVAWSLFFEFVINVLIAFTRFRGDVVAILWLISIPALAASFYLWQGAGGAATADFLGGFARVAYSFFIGILIFHLFRAGRLPKVSLPWWVCLIILLVIYMPVFEHDYYNIFLTFVGQPLLFIVFANSKIEGVPAQIALTLGLMSYAIYIFHIPILYLVESIASQLAGNVVVPWAITLPVTMAIVLALSYWMTFRFDVATRRWMRNFAKRRNWFPESRIAG
jgi:peptidoglycan/LPS O-acetylase OafA/YrhL